MYPFERFTERAKKVLLLAQEEAERSRHSYIGTEHLLLGLLREHDGLGSRVLDNLGIDIGRVRATIESVIGRDERILIQQLIPTSRVKRVIEISFDEARRMGHEYVGTEHVLLGLLIEGEGIGAHVLMDLGATIEKVRAEIERLLQGEPVEHAPMRRSGYLVGDRVLVHDSTPPYRLTEGRVAKAENTQYDIVYGDGSTRKIEQGAANLIHPVPMTWTRDCPFCRAR